MFGENEESGIVVRSKMVTEIVEAEFIPAPGDPAPMKTHQPGMSAHQLASGLAYVSQVLPKSKEDPKLRRVYLSTERKPGTGGLRLVLGGFDTHRGHEAYVDLPDGVTVTPQAISAERAERLRLECETAIKTGYTSAVHVRSALLWEMHDGFEPKTLELGRELDLDTWKLPGAFDGPAPPKKHELKHGRQALSYKAAEDSPPCERSFVDGQGYKFVILTDGSGAEVARARIAPLGWHDEADDEDKRQSVIPGTRPAAKAKEPPKHRKPKK